MHTLPFLLSPLPLALTVASAVVGCELVVSALIRNWYCEMNFWLSVLQVIVGGGPVFLANILIGSS